MKKLLYIIGGVVVLILIIVIAGGGEREEVGPTEEEVATEEEVVAEEADVLIDVPLLIEKEPFEAIDFIISQHGEPFPEGLVDELKQTHVETGVRQFGSPAWFIGDYDFQISFYSDNTYTTEEAEPFYIETDKHSKEKTLESFNLQEGVESYELSFYEFEGIPGIGVGIDFPK